MALMYKAFETSEELADILAKRFPTYTLTKAYDTDGYPVFTLSEDATPAFSEKVFFVKVCALTTKDVAGAAYTLNKDVLGTVQNVYDKTVIQFVTEKNYEGATDNTLDILGPAQLLPFLGEVLKRGTCVEWYRSNNGTVPSAAGITGTAAATWYPDFYHPLVSLA